MRRFIDIASIITEARMMWCDCKVPYVLVEGASDKLFLSTLLGEAHKVILRDLGGWENVNNAIQQAKSSNFPQIVGIIDKDYHDLIGDAITPSDQLLFTDENDIEMMLFSSTAFDRFLKVCGSDDKVNAIPDPREVIKTAAYPIGALRILSLSEGYYLRFDGLNLKDFVERNNLAVDVNKMIHNVVQRTISRGTRITVPEEEIKNNVLRIMSIENHASFCNGHDVFNLICLAMTKLFATSSSKEYSEEDIFHYLLVGYPKEDFFKTSLYNSLEAHLSRVFG